MKHIKTFELTTEDTKPQLGDYVICEEHGDSELTKFLKNNIGQVIILSTNSSYLIHYSNIPKYLHVFFRFTNIGGTDDTVTNNREMFRHEIIHFSPNKEKLEIYIQANKYNL